MAEPFKLLINPAATAAMGSHVARAGGRSFDRSGFEQLALTGLDALALKARAMPAARALVATLPADVDHAAGLLEAALGPAGAGDELSRLRTGDAGLAGRSVWPLTVAVALLAADHAPARGLQALHATTQRLTAEFAIRPFLIRHPRLGFQTLARWAHDPRANERRLVSEGGRPRLPRGLRLQALVADRSPALPLLAQLQDDPSAYVRRSVARHVKDINKGQPALIAGWLARHVPGTTAERQALLRHASRSRVKQAATARPRCSRAG